MAYQKCIVLIYQNTRVCTPFDTSFKQLTQQFKLIQLLLRSGELEGHAIESTLLITKGLLPGAYHYRTIY